MNLPEVVKSSNITQEFEIAEVGKSYISEILNYKKRMSKKVIRNLANHFKIRQEVLNRPYRLKKEQELSNKLRNTAGSYIAPLVNPVGVLPCF